MSETSTVSDNVELLELSCIDTVSYAAAPWESSVLVGMNRQTGSAKKLTLHLLQKFVDVSSMNEILFVFSCSEKVQTDPSVDNPNDKTVSAQLFRSGTIQSRQVVL